MTGHADAPPVLGPHRADRPPPRLRAEVDRGLERSVRRGSLVAGAGLVAMAVLGGVGNFAVLDALVTPGDTARTAAAIAGSLGAFRLAVASLVVVVILDVVVAWALLQVFVPVSEGLATLAAWFRLAYAAVFLVAIGQLVGIPALLAGPGGLTGSSAEQVNALVLLRVTAFTDLWGAGLALFGVHLLLVGVLAVRSGYVPRLVGVLVAIAGAGYAIDSLAAVLIGRPTVEVSVATFAGELLLAVWLLARGRRVVLGGARPGDGRVEQGGRR